ncbi:replication initiation factor domain-containing protein [Metabacillus sp. JX24]|uniref:replication initiation factor domain-containing protein n=1 Tax=Metabacillus sp. JX24 TaxID=3240759 RepID=UPI00350FF6AB
MTKKRIDSKQLKVPYTNRGVGRTLENDLRACVDWVEATFKTVSPDQLILGILQLDPNTFYHARGQNGYRQCLRNEIIAIYFDGAEDMGIHLEIKGRGCREYESYNKRSWKELLESMLSYQASFSRLDVALDDFKGFFTIKGILRKVKNRELVSEFKKARNYEDICIKTGKGQGLSLRFGSDKSDVQIRMYDKLAELTNTNNEVSADITFWNRTEIQLRNERAQVVALRLAAEEEGEITIGKTVCGILKHYLRFTVKGNDTNNRRWKTAPFWNKFLNGVDKLPLTTRDATVTIESKERWINRNVATSLAAVYIAHNENMELIEKYILEGYKRLRQEDYNMINNFKEKKKKTSTVGETMKAYKSAI